MIFYTHELTNEKLSAIANLPDDDTVTFDGIKKSVYELWDDRLSNRKNIILFPVGGYVGRFGYCDWNEIMDMVFEGAKLGWHTMFHHEPHYEYLKDIDCPYETNLFALPYGRFTETYLKRANELYQFVYGTNVEGENILTRKEL